MGDRLMGKAFQFLIQHKDRFPQVSEYEGFDTRFSEAMLLEHTPTAVLDMINCYKYLPELVVINVGAFDFTRFSNSQQQTNIKMMVSSCKALTKQVVRPTDNFQDFFLNLMISLPWYMGWKSQRAARRARSHFSGCLTSVAHDQGCYIVRHDGIKDTIGHGLFDTRIPGDLSEVSLSMFLADIVLLIKRVCKPIQVAQEAKLIPFCMSRALHYQSLQQAVQALHIDQ